MQEWSEKGLDLEPIIALGSKCGVADPQAILYLYNLCSRVGVDVLTIGSVLAFAMEAYEKGILTQKDTEGIELTWGNYRAMEEMIYRIARRQGLGKDFGGRGAKGSGDDRRGGRAICLPLQGIGTYRIRPERVDGHCPGLCGVDPRAEISPAFMPCRSSNGILAKGKEEFGTEKAVDRLAYRRKRAVGKKERPRLRGPGFPGHLQSPGSYL